MNKSDEIKDLASALSKLQGEIVDASKDKKGYGYNYADLSQVLDITRPLLSKYGLSVTQLLYSELDSMGVETCLLHESGQWISSRASIVVERGKGMILAQSAGSVVTYLRRYALAALVGICQTDNDASVETKMPPLEVVMGTKKTAPTGVVNNLIEELKVFAEDPTKAAIIQKALNNHKVKFVNELPSSTLDKLVHHFKNQSKEAANV